MGQVQQAESPLSLSVSRQRQGCGCGCLIWFFTFVMLVGLGGGAYWLGMDASRREVIATRISDALQGTSLDFLRRYLLPYLETSPPVPPINESGDNGIIKPSSASSQISPEHQDGNKFVGVEAVSLIVAKQSQLAQMNSSQMASDAAGGKADSLFEASGKPISPAVIPPVQVDEHIQPAFVDDLAAWIVSRYRPNSRERKLSLSVEELNQRYGAKLTGLGGAGMSGRSKVLGYALTPSMVQGLYGLYAGDFLQAIAKHASQPSGATPLTQQQLVDLYRVLGSQCTLLAGGMESLYAMPDLPQRLAKLDTLNKSVKSAHAEMQEVSFTLSQLRGQKAALPDVHREEVQASAASARLRTALLEEKNGLHSFAEEIRRGGAQGLNEETLLYLARWVGRRISASGAGRETVHSISVVLRDLANRCQKMASAGTLTSAPRPLPSSKASGRP